ncbi:MAG TPA: helix-turn-helix domain-containing protein, partial [Steroidobacteraceae bacterium]
AYNIAQGRGQVQLSPRALAALALYPWPGNVRELANLIERLSIVCAGRIAEIKDLPPKYRPTDWNADWSSPPPSTLQADAPAIETPPLPREFVSPEPVEEPPAFAAEPAHASASSPAALNDAVVLPEEGIDLREYLLNIERQLVTQALERSNGVVAHAARLLNLRRTTLVEKLRKLGIESFTATED